ncbi:hypothetical protein AKG38_19255 [Pectobacterium carotovorum subsp. carotovorum]|nr:hypothetical protein [Pectobacterium carotovorum subsp. carotovorum]
MPQKGRGDRYSKGFKSEGAAYKSQFEGHARPLIQAITKEPRALATPRAMGNVAARLQPTHAYRLCRNVAARIFRWSIGQGLTSADNPDVWKTWQKKHRLKPG